MTRILSSVLLLVLTLLGFAAPLAGQRPQVPGDLGVALDAERRGDFVAAVVAYQRALAANHADASALLGLERSLEPLNRSGEMLAPAQAAVARAPGPAAYSALVRAWVAHRHIDSAQAAVRGWSALAKGEPAPYRELVQALVRTRQRAEAKRAVEWGRAQLGNDNAMAYDMAQLRASEGDWAGATREWLAAARELPGYRLTALAALTPVPERERGAVRTMLGTERTLEARELEAGLLARWGDPDDAVKVLIAALPSDRVRASEALRGFATGLQTRPEAARARGAALEELARRNSGDAAARARVEAAQAYQQAGDQAGARRVLAALPAGRGGPAAASAAATLVGVLLSEGKPAQAEAELGTLRDRLPADEWQALRRSVALGWARAGQLDRGAATLVGDSTVEGLAMRGRLAIFRGDLKGAVDLFRSAGPYAGSREEAAHRTALLALVQPIASDTLPALGAALLALERGDSARGAAVLEQVGEALPADQGGAGVMLLAASVRASLGDSTDAEALLRKAVASAVAATAPAAELDLARLLLAQRRSSEAVSLLEHLILTWPRSATVPEARRALDEAKGAGPPT
jgi:tetratricopeptide (TPR) repeat protein